jgi:hypothetical protein
VIDLPWQPISTLTPELGSDPVYVWNGEVMLFANWRYGWDVTDSIDTNEPCWCDNRLVLIPQPTMWLPLSPPKAESRPKWPLEIRRNPDDTLDEIVCDDAFVHLEQMSDNHWWLGIEKDGRLIHVNFNSSEPIQADAEDQND